MTGLLIDIAGWGGAACLLLAYGLVSAGRLSGRGFGFQLLNLFGALGLLANGVWHGAWPSAALNAIWLIIGAQALSRLCRAERGTSASSRPGAGGRPPAAGRTGR